MITRELAQEVDRLRAGREPFVLATVVRARRPTSVRAGDTALVLADGSIVGFVGGTCAQASVRLYAARALETDEALLLRLIPGDAPEDGDADADDGVVVAHNPCLSGGSLDILLDPQLPALRLVVAGDTPIARAVEEVGRAAGYDVDRADAATLEPRPTDAAVIVASHGNQEEVLLARALQVGVGYVALVASVRRGTGVVASLDVPDALRDRVHTPAGLDIGSRTPAEVAISILAQLIAERTANPMTAATGDRTSPASPATAIDPICGMEVVASASSVHLDVDGERVYFCCEGCRTRFVDQRAEDARAR